MKPDLLVIGAQRSGTTWINALLRDHKDTTMPTGKEVHWFDVQENLNKPISIYYRKFGSGFSADVTPAYAALDQSVVDYVYSCLGDTKIHLTIRNPIDRIWSAARRWRLNKMNKASIAEYLKWEPQILRSDYQRTIEIWNKYFDVHISWFDDLVSHKQAFADEFLDYCGLSRTTKLPPKKLSSPKVEKPDWFDDLVIQYHGDMIRRNIEYLGPRAEGWL
jgi:hypothetical protein